MLEKERKHCTYYPKREERGRSAEQQKELWKRLKLLLVVAIGRHKVFLGLA